MSYFRCFGCCWACYRELRNIQTPDFFPFPILWPSASVLFIFFSSYSLPALARKTGFELGSVAPVVPHLLLLLFCVLLLSVPHVENENLYDPHKYQHRDIGFVFGPRFERLVLQI